jgi:two-component system NtrC family sensor kinase
VTKERLEYLLTWSPVIVYTCEPYDDYIVTFVSENVLSQLGYAPRELFEDPKFWPNHIHPDEVTRVLTGLCRLSENDHYAYEYRFLHKNGTYRWVHDEMKLARDDTGRPSEIIGYLVDISERKQMEERLLQAERLAAIGKTTAMVGHDLRNPLQGMTTLLYLAKRALKSRKAAGKREVAGLLNTFDGQIAYMEKIVADLQDYARPLTPELVGTSLTDLIRDTLSTTKVPRNVKVSVQVEKGIGKVLVDAGLMRRVLTNLTTNSIQSMPKGGKLTIRAERISDATVIAVEDTGVGIPEEDLGKLFEPFFTTNAKGQGFGLAVCKRLVEAHGGTITAKSTPGKGSTFTIQIPVNKKR